jgi:hypothetical protein
MESTLKDSEPLFITSSWNAFKNSLWKIADVGTHRQGEYLELILFSFIFFIIVYVLLGTVILPLTNGTFNRLP